MTSYLGIFFAFIALLGWGTSDLLAQKSIKMIGVWKSLLIGDLVSFFIFLPFIWNKILILSYQELILLVLSSIVYTFASLFYFFGLGRGKMATVEPMNGMELILTVGLGMTLGGEKLSLIQTLLILAVFMGIVLAVTINYTHLHYHKRIIERGVILAGVGAIGMALTNFLVGISSHQISPVIIVWFIHTIIGITCLVYIIYQRQFKSIFFISKKTFKNIIGYGLLNNAGWLGFAFSTTFIPISIATTISEGYIALAALLGIFINRERLKLHQKIGVAIALVGIIFLSIVG